MCLNEHANRVEVCTVGNLKPGDQYRTPEGNTLLVIDDLFDGPGDAVRVVDIATGTTDYERGSVKLGRDRAGRLYASRYLNPDLHDVPTPTAIVEEGVDLGTGEVGPADDGTIIGPDGSIYYLGESGGPIL